MIFSHKDFNLKALEELKKEKGLTVSVAIPTLNEEKAIGKVIDTIKKELMTPQCNLVDEIVVVDSQSTDNTGNEVKKRSIKFLNSSQILPQTGAIRGKGENLWKSIFATNGDLIVWYDADTLIPHPSHVYGLLGPLITNDNVNFVKSIYPRHTHSIGKKHPLPNSEGRVSRLCARPIINLLFPELSHVYQPYNGHVAGRRKILETLQIPTGYGSDLTLLIDVAMKHGPETIAQVFTERFDHNGQNTQNLGKMSFQALRAVLYKAQEYGRLSLHHNLPTIHKQLLLDNDQKFTWEQSDCRETIRPAAIQLSDACKTRRPLRKAQWVNQPAIVAQ